MGGIRSQWCGLSALPRASVRRLSLLAGIALCGLTAVVSATDAEAAARCYFPTFSGTCSTYGQLTVANNYFSSPTPVPDGTCCSPGGASGAPYMFNQSNGTSKRIDRRFWGTGTLQCQYFGSVQNFQADTSEPPVSAGCKAPRTSNVNIGLFASSSWVCVNVAGGTVNVRCGYVYPTAP